MELTLRVNETGGIEQMSVSKSSGKAEVDNAVLTGVIREGVTKYLRRNKHVKSFEYAPQNAGGSGATIVTFK